MVVEMICSTEICIDLSFPLYAIVIVGSFFMVAMNRLEDYCKGDYIVGFCLQYAEVCVGFAILLAIGDVFLIHLIGLSIEKVATIAGLSITFITTGVVIVFGVQVYMPLMGVIRSVQQIMKI